jgi:5-methylcytosine-specific restriction endonuclease McrA
VTIHYCLGEVYREARRAGTLRDWKALEVCICGRPLPLGKRGRVSPNRLWCSNECVRAILDNHSWTDASRAAIRANASNARGPHCQRCRRRRLAIAIATEAGEDRCDGRLEVNHIVPLYGNRPSWGCVHHQDGLQVLCHGCHVDVTNIQRRARMEIAAKRMAQAVLL